MYCKICKWQIASKHIHTPVTFLPQNHAVLALHLHTLAHSTGVRVGIDQGLAATAGACCEDQSGF